MRKLTVNFIVVLILTCLTACTESKKSYLSKENTRLTSYYGFVVYNENGRVFYKIEDKDVQQYINKDVNDTNLINKLISKTNYIYGFEGKSIDYFAWGIYETMVLEKENQLIQIDIPNCKKVLKSKVLPVLLVSMDDVKNQTFKIEECNKFLNRSLLNQPSLSVRFISPLDPKREYKYQNIRDTISLNSKEYQQFLKLDLF